MAKMYRIHELQSLAYFDGKTVDEIAELELNEHDLRIIAGWCGKYAYETAKLDVRELYLERADALSALATQAYIMELEIA